MNKRNKQAGFKYLTCDSKHDNMLEGHCWVSHIQFCLCYVVSIINTGSQCESSIKTENTYTLSLKWKDLPFWKICISWRAHYYLNHHCLGVGPVYLLSPFSFHHLPVLIMYFKNINIMKNNVQQLIAGDALKYN